MDHPLLLLFGVIAISTLLFALTRSLCRDPEMVQADVDRERQRALAEAVVRHLDTHDLVAIASGRLGAGMATSRRGLTSRAYDRSDGDQAAGVSQETRSSFVKMSAGRAGCAHTLDATAARPTATGVVMPEAGCKDHEGRRALLHGSDRKSIAMAEERSVPMLAVSSAPAEGAGYSSRPRSGRRFVIAGVGVPPAETPDVIDGVGGAYADNPCSVCLDEYQEGEQLLQLTCGHVFHRPCINLWLKGHRVCPSCRTDLDKLALVAQVFPTTSRRSLQEALTRAHGNTAIAIEYILAQSDHRPSDAATARGTTTATVEAAEDIEEGRAASGEGVTGCIASRFRRSGSAMWAGAAGARNQSGIGSGSHGSNDDGNRQSVAQGASRDPASPETAAVASARSTARLAAAQPLDVELGSGGIRAGEAGAAAAATVAEVVAADENQTRVTRPRSTGSLGGMAAAWAWRRRSESDSALDTRPARAGRNGATAPSAWSAFRDFFMSTEAHEGAAASDSGSAGERALSPADAASATLPHPVAVVESARSAVTAAARSASSSSPPGYSPRVRDFSPPRLEEVAFSPSHRSPFSPLRSGGSGESSEEKNALPDVFVDSAAVTPAAPPRVDERPTAAPPSNSSPFGWIARAFVPRDAAVVGGERVVPREAVAARGGPRRRPEFAEGGEAPALPSSRRLGAERTGDVAR